MNGIRSECLKFCFLFLRKISLSGVLKPHKTFFVVPQGILTKKLKNKNFWFFGAKKCGKEFWWNFKIWQKLFLSWMRFWKKNFREKNFFENFLKNFQKFFKSCREYLCGPPDKISGSILRGGGPLPPPAASVICGQPLKGLILLKIAGWLAPVLQNVRINWRYFGFIQKVRNCPLCFGICMKRYKIVHNQGSIIGITPHCPK